MGTALRQNLRSRHSPSQKGMVVVVQKYPRLFGCSRHGCVHRDDDDDDADAHVQLLVFWLLFEAEDVD